jgi:hypothetical protein
MRIALFCFLFLISWAEAAPAQQSARDVRCLLVSTVFANSADQPDARRVAEQTRTFFLGRLDARMTPGQIAQAFAAEKSRLAPAAVASTMNACARYMMERTAAVQSSGSTRRR